MDNPVSLNNVAHNHANAFLGNGQAFVELAATPLANQIPKAIRKKIWSNEFVVFSAFALRGISSDCSSKIPLPI